MMSWGDTLRHVAYVIVLVYFAGLFGVAWGLWKRGK
jgi:hypothetical protein